MTKKLEQLFDLPDLTSTMEDTQATIDQRSDQIREIDIAIDKIDAALPGVRDLEVADNEMDELAKMATDKFEDLMDLGMNVEVRYASRIFEVASSMMGNAITAKSTKIDKKLKAIDIQLKKYKIDKDNNEDPNDVINGQGYVITDRNELIKKLSGKA